MNAACVSDSLGYPVAVPSSSGWVWSSSTSRAGEAWFQLRQGKARDYPTQIPPRGVVCAQFPEDGLAPTMFQL